MPASAERTQAGVEAHCVDPKFIRAGWAIAAPLLKPAMKRGGLYRFADLERGVLYGNSLLWLVLEEGSAIAAVVTDLLLTDDEKLCFITACGGSRMRRWLPLIAKIEAYARAERCTRVRILGRRGFARLLEDYHTSNCVVLDRRL